MALIKSDEKKNIVLRPSMDAPGNIGSVPRRILLANFYTYGYFGTGPCDLALNILFHWSGGDLHFAKQKAAKLAEDVISKLPMGKAIEVSGEMLSAWVENEKNSECGNEVVFQTAKVCEPGYVWNNLDELTLKPSVLT